MRVTLHFDLNRKIPPTVFAAAIAAAIVRLNLINPGETIICEDRSYSNVAGDFIARASRFAEDLYTDDDILALHQMMLSDHLIMHSPATDAGRRANAIQLAVIRLYNNVGPDMTDEYGERAYARVQNALYPEVYAAWRATRP